MGILINFLIFLVVLYIVWLLIHGAASLFGVAIPAPIDKILGLIFLLACVIQLAGLLGYGSPVIIYK